MNRRDVVFALAALGASPFVVFAQQTKVWRIGVLETTSMASNTANLDAFRKGLKDLGYVEGKNYVIEYRSADGRNDRFSELAAELVRLKVDVIVTRGTPATQACQKATSMIPVVTTAVGDPVAMGLIASLARPGGNITGLTSITSDLEGKRLQLLKEIIPALARIANLSNMGNPAVPASWKGAENAARSTGIQPLLLDVRKREDLAPAFEDAVKRRAGALIVSQDGLIQTHGKLIVGLAARHRLPAIFPARDYVIDGGLISYGVSYADMYRRAASYVDRIFKGAKPGDLPMEQPTKFDMMINLKTAKAPGLTIPQSALLRADEVIQ